MAIVRIAIAGSGGLAQHLAHYVNDTVHYFIILSRSAKPKLEELGYQVAVVNYDNVKDLTYVLRGVDLVISTIPGNEQINLIDAAFRAEVRRFVPSEFEGPPTRRQGNDFFDNGRAGAISFLKGYPRKDLRRTMQITTFTCGVFYERFCRGGLVSKGVAVDSPLGAPGSYLVEIANNSVDCVEQDSAGRPVTICLTSLSDVAQFFVAALNLGIDNWPSEFRMRGDRLTVTKIIEYAEEIRQVTFSGNVYSPTDLAVHLQHAQTYQDHKKTVRLQALVSTLNQHYDYRSTNLNGRVDFRPMKFWDWLSQQWSSSQAL